jgi:hypothetical protein
MEPPRGNAFAAGTAANTDVYMILMADDLEVLMVVTMNCIYLHVVSVTTLFVVQGM